MTPIPLALGQTVTISRFYVQVSCDTFSLTSCEDTVVCPLLVSVILKTLLGRSLLLLLLQKQFPVFDWPSPTFFFLTDSS